MTFHIRLSGKGKTFRRTAVLAFLLTAQVHAEPYVDIGLFAETNRYHAAGSNPIFKIRAGFLFDANKASTFGLEVEHRCSLLDGSPFNNRVDERQQNSIGLYWRHRWRTGE